MCWLDQVIKPDDPTLPPSLLGVLSPPITTRCAVKTSQFCSITLNTCPFTPYSISPLSWSPPLSIRLIPLLSALLGPHTFASFCRAVCTWEVPVRVNLVVQMGEIRGRNSLHTFIISYLRISIINSFYFIFWFLRILFVYSCSYGFSNRFLTKDQHLPNRWGREGENLTCKTT